jgi:predicted small secreted protein
MRKSGRGTLWAALLLGSFALAACSNPVAVEHTISSGNHTISSGNHTISSGNLRQSRLQRPQTSADVGRRLDDASRVR